MAIRIGHASIDERGKISGGKIGDQTGKEICTRTWYSKPWNVYLECTDTAMAEEAAKYMELICANNNYGYDQSQRTTGYTSIIKNGYNVLNGKGEFDCSSLVSACYIFAGLNIPICTTRTLKNALIRTGKFVFHTSKNYLNSDTYAKRGAIYLKEGSHVVMALTNGSDSIPSNRKEIQIFLNTYYGSAIKTVIGKLLVVDGIIGANSKMGLAIAFQVELNKLGAGIKVDGAFGTASASAFANKVGTLKIGSKGIFVTLWQCLLLGLGINPKGIDGIAGNGFISATNTLFSKYGLPKDSIVSGTDIAKIL